MKTIALFGDSLSEGIISENNRIHKCENNVSSQLEKYFDICIYNNSSFGRTLKKVIEKQIIENYVKKLNPQDHNIIVLCLGGNDSDYDWISVSKNPMAEIYPKTPLKEFSELYSQIIKYLKSNNIDIYVVSLPPVISELYFKKISTYANSKQIMKFFHGDISNINRGQEAYNLEILKIAKQYDCKVIDLRTRMLLEHNLEEYYSEDGIHLNQKGYDKIAQIATKEIQNFWLKK